MKKFRKVEPAKPTKSPGNKRKRQADKSNLLASPLPEVGLGMTKSVANNKVVKIDTINFGNYVTGTQALGYVLQVHDDAVVMSLPGGVSGTVQLSEVSDIHNKLSRQQLDKVTKTNVGDLTDIFSVMQPLRCYVLNTSVDNASTQQKTKGRKTLNLSIRPTYVNRGLTSAHMSPGMPIFGTISSVEDRIYMISTGISGFTFILPFGAVPTSMSPLRLGQPVDTLVESVNTHAKTITLRAQRKAVTSAIIPGVKLTFNSLSPGMLVKVVIDKVVDNGLIVGFLGLFFGTIDNYSLSRLYSGKDEEWKALYEEGGTTQARIIYVDHAKKSIRLSLRPHVIEYRSPKYLPDLGDILTNYKVSAIIKRTGVYITSDDSSKDDSMSPQIVKKGSKKAAAVAQKQRDLDEAAVKGVLVHKSSLADSSGGHGSKSSKDSSGWESHYKIGKSMDVRVSGYHLVEGIAMASNVDAFMTGSVVHSSQVEVGQVLEVEVLKVADFGLVVKLGGKVRAICPIMHLSDTAGLIKTSQLLKKFKAGQKLTMRVWEVKGTQIVMTNKKSLVQTDFALTSYSQAAEGTVAMGIVSKVSQSGLQIHFFNKVKGDISSTILVQQGVTDIEQNYRIGQVVECFILKRIDPNENSKKINSTLVLGLNLGDVRSLVSETSPTAHGTESVESSRNSGESSIEAVCGTVIKKVDDSIHLRLESGELALLHRDHLSDSSSHSESMFTKAEELYPVGSSVKGVHLGVNKNGSVNISVKPLYLAVARIKSSLFTDAIYGDSQEVIIPSKIGDLSPGQILAGSIWKVESYGILVRFRNGMTALAPRPNIADAFISSPVGLFHVGDSVRCVVQRVDMARERALISLKPTVVSPSTGIMTYLESFLNERYCIYNSTTLNWKENSIGRVVKATVSAVKAYGVVLVGMDNVTMMLAKANNGEASSFSEGDTVEALVLDIDFDNNVLDVTLDAEFVANAKKFKESQMLVKKKSKKRSTPECVVGEICRNCVVVLVKAQYLVVLMKGLVCFVMVADYHCPYLSTVDFKVNQSISVKVERCLRNNFGSYLNVKDLPSPYSLTAVGIIIKDDGDVSAKQSTSEKGESEVLNEDIPRNETKLDEQKFLDSLRVGSVLKWEVSDISATNISVRPGNLHSNDIEVTASIHVSSAVDGCDGCDDLEAILDDIKLNDDVERYGISRYHPFHGLSIGAKILGRVIQVRHLKNEDEGDCVKKRIVVYLSLLPTKRNDKGSDSNRWRRMLQWSGRESIKMNGVYAGAITAIHRSYCQIALSPYISANVSIVDISNDASLVEKFRDYCHIGMKVTCVVTEIITSRQKNSISVSRALVEDIASGSSLADLTKTITINISDKESSEGDFQCGDVILGVVDLSGYANAKKPPALSVTLPNGKRGRVCVTEISDKESWNDYADLFASHAMRQQELRRRHRSGSNVSLMSSDSAAGDEDLSDIQDGSLVKCCVLTAASIPELSLRDSRVTAKSRKRATAVDTVPNPGDIVKGYVVNTTSKGCFVRLSSQITGRVLIKELSDNFIESPMDVFTPGKLVKAKVISVTDNSQGDNENFEAIQVNLTLRDSIVNGDGGNEEFDSLNKGDIVSGTVHRVTDFGVFVAINGTSLIGLSRKAMAAPVDDDLSAIYEEGDRVRAVVISKSSGHKIALGLKSSYFDDEGGDANGEMDEEEEQSKGSSDDDEERSSDEDSDNDDISSNQSSNENSSKEDDVVSDSSGEESCENEESNDESDEDDNFIVGYEDVSNSDDDSEVEKLIREAALHTGDTDSNGDSDDESVAPRTKKAKTESESDDSDTDSDSDDDENDDNSRQFMSNGINASTSSSGQMQINWGEKFKPAQASVTSTNNGKEVSDDSDDDSVDEEDEVMNSGHSGRKKKSERRKEEETTRQKEKDLLDGNADPSSADDFERLLITQPNSSLLWIQYMSFFMMGADIESARAIANRALRTINFREEDEKYNVWVAWINLEHKYGTMSSLEKCFKRGVSESKGKYLYIHLAELYDKADDVKGCRLLFEKALKKHKTSKKVWMAYQHFELRRQNDKEARALLGRSMQSLSRHKHVEVIIQYASLHFEMGDYDSGREVFEDLLQNYPKRTDVWNVYVDKEVKYKNFDCARRIFERMICLKISAKNMKSVFKKYLTFELNNGTATEQNGVKQKAREYVESLMT